MPARHLGRRQAPSEVLVEFCLWTSGSQTTPRYTYFKRLLVNTLGAHVVVAGVDQSHGLWERRQLRDVVLSNHQLLQLRQTQEGPVFDGRDLIGR